MCSSASGNSASPHSSSMKPICATVDQASEVFTVGWVSITRPPNSAVKPPTIATSASTPGASSITSAKRTSRKPPALMTPACRSADTGVGVSMTSISQPWVGNCADFSMRRDREQDGGGDGYPPLRRPRAAARSRAMSVVP